MPNYVYKCKKCKAKYNLSLPMGYNPTLQYACQDDNCNGLCSRIIAPGATFSIPKVRAAAWFKKTYGKELGE